VDVLGISSNLRVVYCNKPYYIYFSQISRKIIKNKGEESQAGINLGARTNGPSLVEIELLRNKN